LSGVGLDSVFSEGFSFPLADFPYPAFSALASNLGPRDFFRVRAVSKGCWAKVEDISSKYLRKLAQVLDCNPEDQAETKRKFSLLLDVSKLEWKYFPITGSSSLRVVAESSKEERDFLVFANAIKGHRRKYSVITKVMCSSYIRGEIGNSSRNLCCRGFASSILKKGKPKKEGCLSPSRFSLG